MADETKRKLLGPEVGDRGPGPEAFKRFIGKLFVGALDVGDAVFQAGVAFERRRIVEWLKTFGTDAHMVHHLVDMLEKGEHAKKEG